MFLALLGICCFTTYAQTSSNTSGGDFSESGVDISYSLGQVVTNSLDESGFTFFQGIQLASEEITLHNESFISINSKELLYPNPTASDAYLSIPSTKANTSYQLFDAQGTQLLNNKVITDHTLVPTNGLSTGIYYMRLVSDDHVVKVFKLIKK